MFDFGIVTKWLDDLLNSVMPGWLTTTIECVLVAVGLLVGLDPVPPGPDARG